MLFSILAFNFVYSSINVFHYFSPFPIGSLELSSHSASTVSIFPAISYECIRTVSVIYPNSVLVDKAAKTISRFVTASNNNWKYLGITALASLVLINPKYAAEHQGVVIDCLEDPDDTIKRKVGWVGSGGHYFNKRKF